VTIPLNSVLETKCSKFLARAPTVPKSFGEELGMFTNRCRACAKCAPTTEMFRVLQAATARGNSGKELGGIAGCSEHVRSVTICASTTLYLHKLFRNFCFISSCSSYFKPARPLFIDGLYHFDYILRHNPATECCGLATLRSFNEQSAVREDECYVTCTVTLRNMLCT